MTHYRTSDALVMTVEEGGGYLPLAQAFELG